MKVRAFTLIEIILVVVVISIVGVLAIPNFSKNYENISLRQSVDDVAYLMRFAHSRSVTTRTVIKMTFEGNKLRLMRPSQSKDPALLEGWERLKGQMGKQLTLSPGIEIKELPSETFFYPDGKIDKVRFSMSGKTGTYFITTKEIRGQVVVLQEDKPSA